MSAVYTAIFDKTQRHTHRYSTNVSRIHTAIRQKSAAEQAAIRQVRQLFDKHDKYVNRNRHDFMFFFAMMRSQHMFAAQASPNSRTCQGRKFFEQPRSHQRPHAPGKRPHAPGTHATRRNIAVAIPLAFNNKLQQHMRSTTLGPTPSKRSITLGPAPSQGL